MAATMKKMALRPGVRAPLRPKTQKAIVTKAPSARAAATRTVKSAITGSRKVRQEQKRPTRLLSQAERKMLGLK